MPDGHGCWMASLALAVTGLRWWTFDYAGSPLPYFDQWLAEFNNLFLLGAVEGPTWGIWFTPHNEHLPVTLKVASMLGFLLNGYWDVKFLALISGLARGVEAVLAWRLITFTTTPRQRTFTWWLCLAALGVPWSAFNALNGMQVSFYFAELAMLGSLLVVQRWSGARSGFALVGLMIAGLLSMGSALAIPPATLTLHLLQRRSRRGFLAAWLVTLAMAAIYAIRAAGNSGTGHTASLTDSIWFYFELLAWPWAAPDWGAIILLGLASLFYFTRKHALSPGIGAAIALSAFALGNAGMLALHRTTADFHPRHWDSLGWLPFGLVIILAHGVSNSAGRPWRKIVCTILLLVPVIGLGRRFTQESWPELRIGHDSREAVVRHYREALLSGSFRAESDRVNAQLAAHDYSFYDDPVGRFAIHPTVAHNIALDPLRALPLLSPDILPVRKPSLTTLVTRRLLSSGVWLIFAGLLGFAWASWPSRRFAPAAGMEKIPSQ